MALEGEVMTPDIVMSWIKVVAIGAGIAMGTFAVYSPAYVWLRKQIFGLGSGILCAVGAVLIIGPIYRTVTVVANEKGFELRLDKLQAEIQKTAVLASAAQVQVAKQQEILDKVSASGSVSTAEFQKLQKQVEAVNGRLSTIARATDAALKGVQELQTQTGMHPASDNESNKARRQLTPYFAPAPKTDQNIGPMHD